MIVSLFRAHRELRRATTAMPDDGRRTNTENVSCRDDSRDPRVILFDDESSTAVSATFIGRGSPRLKRDRDTNANSRSHRELGMFTRGRNDNNRKRIERRVHYRATVARNPVCRSRLTGADAGKLAAISGTLSAATHHGAIP